MSVNGFTYPVTAGWIRSVATRPSPNEPWPDVTWDDDLLQDQIRFLDVQSELGVKYNRPWGLFVSRCWPVPFDPRPGKLVSRQREEMIARFVDAAHQRGIKILAGTGVYSWGFEEVIRKCPGVAPGRLEDGRNPQAMCAFADEAWDWQRRVLDFQMDPRWGFDGVSMQSADQGRCQCARCRKLSDIEHHEILLVRTAEHIMRHRPEWVIGQASWGLRLDDPRSLAHVQRISQRVDYIVEVQERSARGPNAWRKDLVRSLSCALGSVGGVFVGHPQHWDRLRWFLPCGLHSARALKALFDDGGRACEYHYRVFANPVEEVSWRTGAKILVDPQTPPSHALRAALAKVFEVTGGALDQLVELFTRAEEAYFRRSNFQLGDGELSLEFLVWDRNPAVPGPPVYLRDRMTGAARRDYAKDLRQLRADLAGIPVGNEPAKQRALRCIDGALTDIATVA